MAQSTIRTRISLLTRFPVATIILAQLFGTSLWFSPNSAADDLIRAWSLSNAELGQLTSAVQLGFIAGTLLLSSSGLADRFAASRIFALACIVGALGNAVFALVPMGLSLALVMRFLVGVSLAGIYPLGMKLVISWSTLRPGQALGSLVAMLTLGTALPHGVRAMGASWSWQAVVLSASVLALVAASCVAALGDGPYARAVPKGQASRPSWGSAFAVFLRPDFRACALGYFGHMWELYAFWTVVPFLAGAWLSMAQISQAWTPGLSFLVIAAGALGCWLAARLSVSMGEARVAAGALALSALMCLLYPLLVGYGGAAVCLLALLVWGASVVADSGQFSALAVRTCPPELLGSALALMNCLGFLLTVLPISLLTHHIAQWGVSVVWLLLPGPMIGLFFFRKLLKTRIN